MDMLGLTGARVLITAGAAGIGREIAQRFRDAGAEVWVTDIAETAVADAAETGLRATVSNAASEDEVRALAAEVAGLWGGLDVLVNNAGIAGPTGPIETLETAAWLTTFDVNIHSQFYCVKHFLPLLRTSGGASIVNLSSAAGRLGMAGRSPYSASKWAVVGLTKTLAIELGPEGIRPQCDLSGCGRRSPHRGGHRLEGADARSLRRRGHRALHRAGVLGKLATAADIGNMAVFLASTMASHVTGQAMAVDGNTEKLY